jgi:hypothetical protein
VLRKNCMFIYLGLTQLEVMGADNKCSVVLHGRVKTTVVDRWPEGLTHWDAAM